MTIDNQLTCLILGPFGDKDAEKIRTVLINVLEEQDVHNVNLNDRMIPGASIAETIQSEIQAADFLVADLTGSNPNVMYELGYAQALGKKIMPIVSRKQDHVPVDLRGLLYFVYDPELSFSELRILFSSWILRVIEGIQGGKS